MLHPLPGAIVSSPFGDRVHPITGVFTLHNGVDYAASKGTPIQSPDYGTVENVYFNNAGGNQVIIKHWLGLTSGYAHLDSVNVSIGDRVTPSSVIGTVGSTGNVTGPHLHFTLKRGEKLLNPEKYISRFTDLQIILFAVAAFAAVVYFLRT